MKRIIAAAALLLAVSGCGSNGSDSQIAPSATAVPTAVGDIAAFNVKSSGDRVGTVRLTDLVALPANCSNDQPPAGGQLVALRFEIANDGELVLGRPDMYTTKVVDSGGFTQNVENANVHPRCASSYPRIAESQKAGKTAGWVAFSVAQANPTAVVYAPMVADFGSTLEDLKLAELSPATARFQAQSPLGSGPGGDAAAPSVTVEPTPAPTTVAAPPAPREGNACDPDSDGWAKDASGQQLYCTYAGAPTPRWVASLPLIGIRRIGQPCEGYDYVAQTASGQPLMCTWDPIKQDGSNSWQPGP